MSKLTNEEIVKLHDWQRDLVASVEAREVSYKVVKVPRGAGKTHIASMLAQNGAHVFVHTAASKGIVVRYGAPEDHVSVFNPPYLDNTDLSDIHTFVFDDVEPAEDLLKFLKNKLVIYLTTPEVEQLGTLKRLTVEQDFSWDGETKILTYGEQKFSWMPEWKLPDWANGRVFYFSTLGSPEARNKTRFDEANKNRVAGSLVGAEINKNHKKYNMPGQNIIVDTEVSGERLEGICYVENKELLADYDAGNIIGCSIDYKDRNFDKTSDYDVEGAFGLGLAWVTRPYVLGYPDSLVWEASRVPEGGDNVTKTLTESFANYVDKELLRLRTVVFQGYVSGQTCAEFTKVLEYLGSVSNEPIKVILNSGGGSVFSGLLVFDTIKQLTASGIEVTCEARGLAASMGAIIVQAGTRRLATPNTRFLIHEVSSWAWGKTSEMEDEIKEIKKVNDMLKSIIAERTGKTMEEIESVWHKRDVWLSAEEALEFGLIDEVIEAPEPAAFKPNKTEEERAMEHSGISPEDWAELTDEEKEAYINDLPVKGSKKLTDDGDAYFAWLNSLELRLDGLQAKTMSATELFKRLEKEEEDDDDDDDDDEEKTLTIIDEAADVIADTLDLDGESDDSEPVVAPPPSTPQDDWFAFIEDGGDAPELRHLQFKDEDGHNAALLLAAMEDLQQMIFNGDISKAASESAKLQLMEGFKALNLKIPEWALRVDGEIQSDKLSPKTRAQLRRSLNDRADFSRRFHRDRMRRRLGVDPGPMIDVPTNNRDKKRSD